MGMRKLARRCQIIDFPLVSARHTERSRTHAMHWSRHRSPGPHIDEFFRSPNQEVRFFLGLGACAVRPGPEGPLASLGYNDEISRMCLCTANSGNAEITKAKDEVDIEANEAETVEASAALVQRDELITDFKGGATAIVVQPVRAM